MVYSNFYGGRALRITIGITMLTIIAIGAAAGTDVSSCITISSPGEYVLSTNINNDTTCIQITSSNVTFDGTGHTIDGIRTSGTYGVYVFNSSITLTNVTLKNLTATDWETGINYENTHNGTIVANNASSNYYYGIQLSSSNNNNLTGNIAESNNIGIFLNSGSNNNNVTGNNVKSSSGIYVYSENNLIYNNRFNSSYNYFYYVYSNTLNISKQSGKNIIGESYLGGNFWANPDGTGFSETCSDADSDGICDSQYDLGSGIIDYLPLTTTKSTLSKIVISGSPTTTLTVGRTHLFTATALDQSDNPLEGIDISWTVSNSSVGNVDSPNVITNVTGGVTSTFTAFVPGTTMVNASNGSVTGTAIVTVNRVPPYLASIEVSPIAQSMFVGDNLTFIASPKDQNGADILEQVSWSSNNTSIGTIDPDTGNFTAISPGIVQVNATNGSVIGTAVVTVAQVPPVVQNLIMNPGFESGTTSWWFYTSGTGIFTAVTPGFEGIKAAKIALTSSGGNIQLYQTGVALEVNTRYRLSFAAYSNNGHDMIVRLFKHGTPYTTYMPEFSVNPGTNWQTFTTEFTSSATGTVNDGRLVFWFAQYAAAGDIYYIDDVRLEKVSSTPVAPAITTHPAIQTIEEGQTATFSVVATGTAPLSYQWQKNSVNISGATSSSYTTPATTASDNGSVFHVIISNSVGSVASNQATLIVTTPIITPPYVTTHPSNQTVYAGQTALFSVVATGTAPLTYQWQKDSVNITGATGQSYRSPATILSDSGSTYRVLVTNSVGSTTSNAATLTVNPTSSVNLIMNPGFESGTNSWSFYTSGTGIFTAVTPGFEGTKAAKLALTSSGGNIQLFQTGVALEANTRYRLSFAVYSNTGHDMIVRLFKHSTPYTAYMLEFTVNLATNWQTFTTEFTSSGFTGTVNDGRLMFWLAQYVAAGDIYYIDDVRLEKVSSTPVAPGINTDPVAQTVEEGQTATFSVVATGTAPMTYQWQKEGVNITGATGQSYTSPATILSDSGSTYRVLVTNSVGSTTSNAATLTVNPTSSVNLIMNPGFESGTNSWWFYKSGTGIFTTVTPGFEGIKAAKLALTSSSGNIQLFQTGVALDANTHYRLSFAAYSNTGHDMIVRLFKHGTPYTAYMPEFTVNLGTNWQTFATELTSSGFTGTVNDGRLMFWLAQYAAAGDIYYIDDVRLEKVSSTPVAPGIITNPVAQTVEEGQTATFSVGATGTAPLTYQWQKNSVDIEGATSASYKTPPTTIADNNSQFRVKITNAYGNVISNAALLTVEVLSNEPIIFIPYSSSDGYLDTPSAGVILTSDMVGDVDSDGIDDFVIAQQGTPSIVWYKKNGSKWDKYIIETASILTDVGNSLYDVDKDGDLDIVIFYGIQSSEAAWWENPGTKNGAVYMATNWTKHLIENTGYPNQHDAKVGDFDGDGKDELAWMGRNNYETRIYVAEIPANPKTMWTDIKVFYTFAKLVEGMEVADIDLDGKVDIIIGGGWLKDNGETSFTFNLIGSASDRSAYESRIAVGQIIPGGRPEVVFGAGDFFGSVAWYEWDGSSWIRHELDNQVDHGHSIALGDLDSDGKLDVFVAEMTNWDIYTNLDSKMRIYRNNGDRTFKTISFPEGINNHESKLGDFDGDGRLDILSKSFANANPPAPELIVWLQDGGTRNVTNWQYNLIDTTREKYGSEYGWFGLDFVDVNNDGYKDIVSGKYYYKNPGQDMMSAWNRTTFPVNVDASLATNVDGDAFSDVIAFGYSSAYTTNPGVYWLEKTGTGDTTFDWTATLVVPIGVIQPTPHSQSQGFRRAQIVPGGKEEIVIAGNNPGKLFYIQIPSNPEAGNWPITVIGNSHNNQGLAVGDINKDGYLDVAGVKSDNCEVVWWENPGVAGQGNWSEHFTGYATPIVANTGSDGPDRVEVADLNGDGRPDILMTDEIWSGTGIQPLRSKSRTYWFAQPVDVDTAVNWGASNQIAEQQSTNSLDVADIDNDGDIDIVTGEHKGDKELVIWKNDGTGIFTKNVISTDKENHNGGQLVDLDGDSDLDIVSITWDDNYVTGGLGLLHMWRNDNTIGGD